MKLEHETFNSLLKHTKALSVALGYRDLLTRLHSERVHGLCREIGEYCGLPNNEINALQIAASFHDIGKLGIPDRILLKPSSLDETERKAMKQHSEIGEKIMVSTELRGARQTALAIRHHHEQYNGMGYPDKLSGKDIPIFSRIISIADSYDAMAVTRPYHHARPHQEIMAILHEESGEKHDPDLIRVFCEIIKSSKFRAKPK